MSHAHVWTQNSGSFSYRAMKSRINYLIELLCSSFCRWMLKYLQVSMFIVQIGNNSDSLFLN